MRLSSAMKPIAALVTLGIIVALGPLAGTAQDEFQQKPRKVIKTDREWAKQLTRPQYMVTRQKATEPPFSGKYVNNHAKGIYTCVCCEADLFNSRNKFESGTGWPSFWRPIDAKAIDSATDLSAGEERIEVMCNNCGAHLGHVFSDGPPPTGLRYCINSLSLKFVKETKTPAKSKDDTTKKKKDDTTKKKDKPAEDEKKDSSETKPDSQGA